MKYLSIVYTRTEIYWDSFKLMLPGFKLSRYALCLIANGSLFSYYSGRSWVHPDIWHLLSIWIYRYYILTCICLVSRYLAEFLLYFMLCTLLLPDKWRELKAVRWFQKVYGFFVEHFHTKITLGGLPIPDKKRPLS